MAAFSRAFLHETCLRFEQDDIKVHLSGVHESKGITRYAEEATAEQEDVGTVHLWKRNK